METWSTATIAVETARGTRYQGVSFAGPLWPARRGMEPRPRLPRGAVEQYRTRPYRVAAYAFEAARSRTIHHNLFHDGETWEKRDELHARYSCPER